MSASASTLTDGQDSESGSLKLNEVAIAGHAVVAAGARVDVQLRHAERISSASLDDSCGIKFAVIRTLERGRSSGTSLGMRAIADVQAWTLSLEGNRLRTSASHRVAKCGPRCAKRLRNPRVKVSNPLPRR